MKYQISNIKYQKHRLNIKNFKIFNFLYACPVNFIRNSIGVFFIFNILFLISAAQSVSAQTPDYPITELGNCRNERECQLYCDIPANTPACWSYGKYVLNPNILGESTVDPEEEARAHGITFPITELGNCTNPSECFIFCNQPQNQTTCLEFAKSKGLIKEEKPPGINPQEMMEAAKKELGCTSDFSCMTFCQNPSNFEKCAAFARNHGLTDPEGERRRPPPEVMEKAKNELGCDSETSCMNVCNNPDNIERCMQFAKKHKLMDEGEIEHQEEFIKKKMEMMEDAKKELGCETPSSCMNFCQKPENRDMCASLAKKHNFGPPPSQFSGQPPMLPPGLKTREDQSIRGPGGCASEKECKEYCQKHPNDCPGFSQPTQLDKLDKFDQLDKASPSKLGDFLGPAGCKTEKECKAYCEKHPNECPGFPKDKPSSSQSSSSPQSPLPAEVQTKAGQSNRPTPNQPPQGGPPMMNQEQLKEQEKMKNEQKPPSDNPQNFQSPPVSPPPQVAP